MVPRRSDAHAAMRLLLVEDDEKLARAMATALSQDGYAVSVAATAGEALRSARQATCDLAILDLGLPDRDGIDLLREMRSDGLTFPVLILSARDGLNDRVRGLDTGADDYLVKPFALAELEARLRALIRRREERGAVRQLGRLRFDAERKCALVGQDALDLTARELTILEAMLSPPGKIVSKRALFDLVFSSDSGAAPNALEVHVSRLRHKLADSGTTVRSIRGLGYRLEEFERDGGRA